jgi:hypothetical protein
MGLGRAKKYRYIEFDHEYASQIVILISIILDMAYLEVKMEYYENVYMVKKILNIHMNIQKNSGLPIKIIKNFLGLLILMHMNT